MGPGWVQTGTGLVWYEVDAASTHGESLPSLQSSHVSPFLEMERSSSSSRWKNNSNLRRGAIRHMPKRHQQRLAKEIHGRNNPKKSTVITTGPYKKPETVREQSPEHKNPNNVAQEAKVRPSLTPSEGRSQK